MSITAILAIKNEVETYRDSIDSIYTFADEVIIADIGMSREIRDVVEPLKKVRMIRYKKKVPYIELIKQELIEKAKGDWIFFLDPDEIVTAGLKDFFEKNMEEYDYFSIPRKNIILNHWMQHSRWWPDMQIRFFRKGSATWSTQIHAQPHLTGRCCMVPAEEKYALCHYNHQSYDQYLEKSSRYAKAEAAQFLTEGTFTLSKAFKLGISEFMSRYYTDDGYKDGMHGFIMAFSQLLYYFQVYVYYWEMNKYEAPAPKNSLAVNFFARGLRESLYWSHAKGLVHDYSSLIKRKAISFFLKDN